MPTFYKGAGLGTHWHKNDSRQVGFTARSPRATPTMEAILTHVAAGTDVYRQDLLSLEEG